MVMGTRAVTAGSDRRVKVWQLPLCVPLLVLERHRALVSCLTKISGRYFCSGSFDGTTVVWDLKGLLRQVQEAAAAEAAAEEKEKADRKWRQRQRPGPSPDMQPPEHQQSVRHHRRAAGTL